MDTHLIDEIRKLPLEERVQLAGVIWDSIRKEMPAHLSINEQSTAELERRWLAHQAAPDESIPWEKVQQKLALLQAGSQRA